MTRGAALAPLSACSPFVGRASHDAAAGDAPDVATPDAADDASCDGACDGGATDASRWFCDGGSCSTQRSCPSPEARGCGTVEIPRAADFSIGSAQAMNVRGDAPPSRSPRPRPCQLGAAVFVRAASGT